MVFAVVKVLVILLTFDSCAEGDYQREYSQSDDPPCFFNPLCSCSKAFPDLGRLTCKDVPLLRIPPQLNTSKVFMFHLENNGLRYIEPHIFQHTGLFKIKISQNLLTDITEESFSGLELSLWELNLMYNKLRRVPNRSFRFLQKLRLLDLSGNEIKSIRGDDWLGLENSLKTLILSHNKLSTLQPRTFSILQQLEILYLSGNALVDFDALSFKNGPPKLTELYLTDNLLSNIPLQELSELRALRHLDLSFNQITEIQDFNHDRSKTTPVKLSLDSLHLDYNQIQYVPTEAFKSFLTINRTYLNGNPIRYIEKNAFMFSNIREIYFKNCEISELTIEAFSGLENFLEILDIDGNNLTTLPSNFFKEFSSLKYLSLKSNIFKKVDLSGLIGERQSSLEHLDIVGLSISFEDLQYLGEFSNLRFLSLSHIPQTSLSSDLFPKFLTELEDLKISRSNIKNLDNHAFKHFRGLRRLDLSDNSISTLQDKAFAEVGHSLFYLSLANALSSSLTQLPPKIFEDLTAVELLDISNNKLKLLSQELFRSMKRLRAVFIHDNFIESIPKRLFEGNVHSEVYSIQLSFNRLTVIETESFKDLDKLEYLWLNDNKITTVEKKAFINLFNLRHLYLQGNKISYLKKASFQDLPKLEKLDLSYNKIKTFNYDCLDQIGTLSSFSIDLSHNVIDQLMANFSVGRHPNFGVFHVNIKALDLSHNNISFIKPGFFQPIEFSVTHVDLSHNNLSNITRNVFGGLVHLQWIDVSQNLLTELEDDAFTNTKNIQVFYLSNNRLQEVPKNFLNQFYILRILDLSSNYFRSLPNNLFTNTKIEKLDISKNKLSVIPLNSLDANSASFLIELDLSENKIMSLPRPEAFRIFKNLFKLNLSKNWLVQIQDGTFSFLRHLHILDISHNRELHSELKASTFHGVENVLENLNLKNLSLDTIPLLSFSSLKFLDVSDNNIITVPYEFSQNLSNLERIELSNNKMTAVSSGITALTELQYLGLSGNPLESINFQQSYNLRELDLRNTSFSKLVKGELGKLPLLENFKLSINEKVQNLNIPQLLKNSFGLSHLYIEIYETADLSENNMKGTFSSKLRNLTLAGRGLKKIPKNLLKGIQSPTLHLIVFNTSLQKIEKNVFDNAENIRNLTLDVRLNKLKTMSNPNTGVSLNIPKKMFLQSLKVSHNDWTCDCSMGWIEMWERKKRQYLCKDHAEHCYLLSDDLRNTICSNRNSKTLFEVIKQDLECDWNKSTSLSASSKVLLLILNIMFWFFIE